MWSRRREGAVQWLALTVLLLGAWAAYVMWSHHPATRFVWPVSVLMFALGSMNLARRAPRLASQPRLAAFVSLGILSLVYVPWILNRQNPFILPELRQFARDVDRLSSGGNVLLLDRLTDEDVLFVQVYRVLIDQERIVHCQWIGACDSVRPDQIAEHDLRTVLGRTEPAGIAVIQPPLATSSSGWSAWKIDRADLVESAPG